MKQYYYTDEQYEQKGPIDEFELIENYKAGKYQADTKVWCDGMSDWQKIPGVMKELGVEDAASVPPPISKPAPEVSIGGALGGVVDAVKSKVQSFPVNKDDLTSVGDKAREFAQSIPKGKDELKALPMKKKLFLGAIAALVLLFCGYVLMPSGVNSDEDVITLAEERMDELDKNAAALDLENAQKVRKYYKYLSGDYAEIRQAAKGVTYSQSARCSVICLFAAFGDHDAISYLIENDKKYAPRRFKKDDYGYKIPDSEQGKIISDTNIENLILYATVGGDETVRYLCEKGFDAAFASGTSGTEHLLEMASMFGRPQLVRWLIDKKYVTLDSAGVNRFIADLLANDNDESNEIFRGIAELFGKKIDIDDLKDARLEIVKYMVDELGADLSSSYIQEAAKKSTNKALVKYVIKKR